MADIHTIANEAKILAAEADKLATKASAAQIEAATNSGVDPFIFGITIFILACFVGYYVVWKVTPALHTPLMAVTNAISGIIIVGAIIAVGPQGFGFSQFMGFIGVVLASVNIFGGFIVTQRMLQMFKKK
jgi:NAD(P) transhydrogenase subunit alpha